MVAPWITKASHNRREASTETQKAVRETEARRERTSRRGDDELIERKTVTLDLTKLLKSELTQLAEEQNIDHKGLTKAQLLEALQG